MSIQPKQYHPEQLTPSLLDQYLENGWFRMRHYLYTTHFLHQQSKLYNAVWLRYALKEVDFTPSQSKLLRKINQRFQVSISRFEYDVAVEDLYLRYCEAMPFLKADSIEALLGPLYHQVFDSHIVKIYDGNKIIAAGIFDVGESGAAGIGSFYHPDYKKLSLGKALLLQKIWYCQQNGYEYFYPGYNVLGHPKFSYKTSVCPKATYYFEVNTKSWLAYDLYEEEQTGLLQMEKQLKTVADRLEQYGLLSQIKTYPLFDAGIWFQFSHTLLQYPIYLQTTDPHSSEHFLAVTYDLAWTKWSVWRCLHRYTLELSQDLEPEEYFDSRLFEAIHIADADNLEMLEFYVLFPPTSAIGNHDK